MSKNIFIGLVCFLLAGCVLTKNHSDLNPLTYVYHSPIEEVRKEIVKQISEGKYKDLPLQVGYNESLRSYSKISESENRNHFFLNKSGFKSVGKSEYYRNFWGKRLELYPYYRISLDSISKNQTSIKIVSVPRVKRKGITTNHGLPIYSSWAKPVKPTTIEEYELIKLIGEAIGEENMPEVKRK